MLRAPDRARVLAVFAAPRWRARFGGVLAALALTGAAACGGDGEPEPATRPPNILLLVSDDQSWNDVGAYGNDVVRTPRIDALAREGMRLDSVFTPSPVCIPSRAALFSGRHPQSSGMVGFGQKGRPTDDVPLLTELLDAAGYRGGEIGKSALFPLSRHPFEYRRYPKLGRGPDMLRPLVREFLTVDDDGRPFFLLMSMRDPHRPFPRRAKVEPESVPVPPVLPDEPGVRREIARYYTGIERLDAVVGAVLDEVEAVGQADSTLVIFTSDHGASFPYAKGTLYDAGMRVPFVVRWPGVVEPGTSSDALISFVDVLPTLMEAAGAPGSVPPEAEGRSFVEVLRGTRSVHRQLVFGDLEFIPKHLPSRAVRSRGFKYVYNAPVDRPYGQEALTAKAWASMRRLAESDPVMKARVEHLLHRPREELYDLANDPAELRDLGADPRHAGKRRELARALGCWMQTTGDPLVIPEERMADRACEPELSAGF